MSAVLRARRTGQEVRAPLGADGLHPATYRPGGSSAWSGPNGAGKSTLLGLACGMLTPTTGSIEVLRRPPAAGAAQLAKVGFVAQDTPIYAGLSVADHLRLGARLNPRLGRCPGAAARSSGSASTPTQKAGRLSGGQRAQLALTVGLAKRPELLILDEPVAALDPLARREFLQDLMEAVAEHELSVVLSSHLVADLERACDHLIVLVDSRVQLAGDVDDLLAVHHRLTGPRRDQAAPGGQHVISRQPHRPAVHAAGPHRQRRSHDPAWTVSTLDLEDIVPGLHDPCRRRSVSPTPDPPGGAAMIWLTWRQFRYAGRWSSLGAARRARRLLVVTGSAARRHHRRSAGWTCSTHAPAPDRLADRTSRVGDRSRCSCSPRRSSAPSGARR